VAGSEATLPSLSVQGTTIQVSGPLTVSTVAGVLAQGRAALSARATQATRLDLGGVSASDSAGLALIVDWMRTARAHGVPLSLQGVPEQLASIAAISGLESLVSGGTGNEPG